MSEIKHSPLPWHPDPDEPRDILAADGELIATFYVTEADDENDTEAVGLANAAFALRAANAHNDLLAAAIQARDYLIRDVVEPGRTVFWNLVDAIKKAEGRK